MLTNGDAFYKEHKSESKGNALIIDSNMFYFLGAISSFIAFSVGIYFAEVSPLFIFLGILGPIGMSQSISKLI